MKKLGGGLGVRLTFGYSPFKYRLTAGLIVWLDCLSVCLSDLSLSQMSFSSSAEVLRDRHRFPSYFRTDPSEEHFSPGLAGIVRYYGWRQIAIITQTESLFLDVSGDIDV